MLLFNLLNFKDIVDNFLKQLFISSAMAFSVLYGIPHNTDYAEKSKMLKYAFLAT